MRMHNVAMLAAALLCVPLLSATVVAREWTDSTGQYHREAEYVGHRDGQVWVRDSAGKLFAVAIERLSQTDRAYLASRNEEVDLPRQNVNVHALSGAAVATATQGAPTLLARADLAFEKRHQTAVTNASIAHLTGWHCYGGHCYVTHHHHPAPVPPPAPSTSLKRIYTGCFSTFHLVRRVPNQLGGTGAYKFFLAGFVHEYLVMLNFHSSTATFLEYSVADSPPPLGITLWAFDNVPVAPGTYRVFYYTTATGWVLYDHAHRRIPE